MAPNSTGHVRIFILISKRIRSNYFLMHFLILSSHPIFHLIFPNRPIYVFNLVKIFSCFFPPVINIRDIREYEIYERAIQLVSSSTVETTVVAASFFQQRHIKRQRRRSLVICVNTIFYKIQIKKECKTFFSYLILYQLFQN